MKNSLRTSAGIVAVSILLSACGGGGGGGGGSNFVSTPPPPPPPSPGPAIIPAATTSQQFASLGAHYSVSLNAISGGQPVPAPNIANNSQLQVRFDSSSGFYEIQVPNDASWQRIVSALGSAYSTGGTNPVEVEDRDPQQQYSALLFWRGPNSFGTTAIGIPTPAGGVPVTGSASYNGSIFGSSSETVFNAVDGHQPGLIGGSILMSFDFGAGSLSGTISPTLLLAQTYSLGTLSFRNTVYSKGSTSFSGEFNTNIPGLNSFMGLFTGPNAQELIGRFAFPYVSPVDGQNEQAAGAFIGRGPTG